MRPRRVTYCTVLVQLDTVAVGTRGSGEICISDNEKQRDRLREWSAPSNLKTNMTCLYDTINHVDEKHFQSEPRPFATISVQLRKGHKNISI